MGDSPPRVMGTGPGGEVLPGRACACMPRKPRAEFEAGLHHVYAHANNREVLFADDLDRQAYLDLLATVVKDFEWRCLGYCLMDNHLHLIIETTQPNLSDGMRMLHGCYAQRFNRR